MRVLEAGGNAIDAGVASVFALTLLKPQSAGIGGECPMLVYHHSSDPLAAEPGRDQRPGRCASPRDHRVVPGAGDRRDPGRRPPRHDRTGHLRRVRRGAAAVRAARAARDAGAGRGPRSRRVRHVPGAAGCAVGCGHDRYRDEYPTTGEVFLHDGAVPASAGGLQQPAWAATFRRIVDAEIARAAPRRPAGSRRSRPARDPFYRGFVAEEIAGVRRLDARASTRPGAPWPGLIATDDLAAYRTRLETPVSVRYQRPRRAQVRPVDAGPGLPAAAALLEGFDLPRLGHNSADYLHTLVEAAKLAFADRERWYGDPRFADVPLERLLSDGYAAERRGADRRAALRSAEFRPGDVGLAAVAHRRSTPGSARRQRRHHARRRRRRARATCSRRRRRGGWLESSPVIPALGFPLGSRLQMFNLDPSHPNALAPGKRPRTTLTPSLATRDGQPGWPSGRRAATSRTSGRCSSS